MREASMFGWLRQEPQCRKGIGVGQVDRCRPLAGCVVAARLPHVDLQGRDSCLVERRLVEVAARIDARRAVQDQHRRKLSVAVVAGAAAPVAWIVRHAELALDGQHRAGRLRQVGRLELHEGDIDRRFGAEATLASGVRGPCNQHREEGQRPKPDCLQSRRCHLILRVGKFVPSASPDRVRPSYDFLRKRTLGTIHDRRFRCQQVTLRRPATRLGNRHLDVPARCNAADGGSDFSRGATDPWPTRGREDDNGDPPGAEMLLVLEVRVGGDEHLEAVRLGSSQQLAIAECRPALLVGRDYRVRRKQMPQRRRRALIEEDAHLGRRERAARSVRQDGPT